MAEPEIVSLSEYAPLQLEERRDTELLSQTSNPGFSEPSMEKPL